MARQPDKINAAVTMLGDGKTSKEITEATGCSASTITIARKRLAERNGDLTEASKDIEADVDENVDNFIKSVKITPDADVLTKDKDKEDKKEHSYQCPECDHEWDAPKNERQDSCPNCGMEFN